MNYEDDRDKRRRRRNPFDFFGFDDDFIKDLLNDERVMEDLRRMTEEMMKMFSTAQPGKPFVHGFKDQMENLESRTLETNPLNHQMENN